MEGLKIYWLTFIASLGLFSFGYALTEYNTIFSFLAALNGWDTAERKRNEAIVNGALPFGALLGSYGLSFFLKHGRRNLMIATDIILLILCPLAYSPDIIFHIVSRFAIGIYSGANCVLVPLYLSEVSPRTIRGKTGMLSIVLLNVGLLCSCCAGFLSPKEVAVDVYENLDSNWWRYVVLFPMIAALTRALGLATCFNFETPTFLLRNGERERALQNLEKIYPKPGEAEQELEALEQAQGSRKLTTIAELLSPRQRPFLFLGIGLAVFSQFTGVNVITFYSNRLMKAQSSSLDARSQAIVFTSLIGTLRCFVIFLSAFVIDRIGRRCLLSVGSIFMGFSLCLIIIFNANQMILLARIAILLYQSCFNFSWGGVPFLMIAELLNDRGISIASLFSWISTLTVVSTAPYIAESSIGVNGLFGIYATLCAVAFAFSQFLLPETKGLSKTEIQALFDKKPVEPAVDEGIQTTTPLGDKLLANKP
eukprot:TRINITY_DN10658_c0_g1_i2.p1 TRINITY_DN10658_c0_g1~~TRINITY_DN10658_c0_g1_i2.p1  ORF type:complete len:480 (+),score=106.59 TRINITY_DN10658_c0_g1_i2:110-1549(+)